MQTDSPTQCSNLHNVLCERYGSSNMLRKHAKSFYFASFFLSWASAIRARALYQVCRIIDDIADGNNQSSVPTPSVDLSGIHTGRIHTTKHLNVSKEDAAELFGSLVSENDLAASGADCSAKSELADIQEWISSCGDRCDITQHLSVPKYTLSHLLSAIKSDLNHRQPTTTHELLEYCYGAAGTVGLMMCDVMRIETKAARVHAMHLGMAMQLTNIARDVWHDAMLNRVYLPKDLVGELHVGDILHTNTQSLATIRFGVEKLLLLADEYYQSGYAGMRYIPRRDRLAIYIAAKLYHYIGARIRDGQYLQPGVKASLSLKEKLATAALCTSRIMRSPNELGDCAPNMATLYHPDRDI